MSKQHTSIRLSEEDKRIRAALAAYLGISENAVMILAMRELAIKYEMMNEPVTKK